MNLSDQDLRNLGDNAYYFVKNKFQGHIFTLTFA